MQKKAEEKQRLGRTQAWWMKMEMKVKLDLELGILALAGEVWATVGAENRAKEAARQRNLKCGLAPRGGSMVE